MVSDNIKKSFIRIVSAAFFFGAAYYALFSMPNLQQCEIKHYALAVLSPLLFGPQEYHLWFLYVLLYIYLLVPLLRAGFSSAPSRYVLWLVLALLFVGSVMPCLNLVFFSLTGGKKLAFRGIREFAYIGCFCMGHIVWQYRSRLPRTRVMIWTAVALAVASLSCIVFYNGDITIVRQMLRDRTSMVNTLFAIMVFAIAARLDNVNISAHTANVLKWLGQASFGIYLLHPIVIGFTRQYKTQLWNTYNTFGAYIVIVMISAIAVFLVSLVFARVLRKFPGFRGILA